MNQNWESPTFCELNMNAEIGSYQEDYGDRDYFAASEPPSELA